MLLEIWRCLRLLGVVDMQLAGGEVVDMVSVGGGIVNTQQMQEVGDIKTAQVWSRRCS